MFLYSSSRDHWKFLKKANNESYIFFFGSTRKINRSVVLHPHRIQTSIVLILFFFKRLLKKKNAYRTLLRDNRVRERWGRCMVNFLVYGFFLPTISNRRRLLPHLAASRSYFTQLSSSARWPRKKKTISHNPRRVRVKSHLSRAHRNERKTSAHKRSK